jgi:hypothetical protein
MRALLAKLALAAAPTLLTLGAAELVVRLAGVDLASDQHYRFHPVLGWTPDPACELFDHVNPQGFRHQIRTPNPEGRRRLVIVGDSFSFAGAYPFASTYAGRLQEWLGKDGSPEEDARISKAASTCAPTAMRVRASSTKSTGGSPPSDPAAV